MIDLKVDWATQAAAKFSCENFHYSRSLPAGKSVKVGAWEDGQFIMLLYSAVGRLRISVLLMA
ncbi:hypothetical protein MHI01_29410 [Paenibacillus sp. FSL M7-0656]|uniref:hypothetical protein n=1 Tax=Paenibacillus sp. FSL M7-0656 TaxID=2921534 RepID=UPI0030F64D76